MFEVVNSFLTASNPTKVLIVVYIIVILYMVSLFIAMTVAASAESLTVKMPSNMMSMVRKPMRFWQ